MFQTFESSSGPEHVAERTKELRGVMAALKIDGLIVPRADEHQGEYVPPAAERLKWLTGFTGSAGCAVVTRKAAVLFTDGRYTVQAKAETDTAVFEISLIARPRISEWIADKLLKGQTLGFDPWLHTGTEISRLAKALQPKGIKLKALSKNPVDRIWGRDRPKPPLKPVAVQPLALAGQPVAEKISALQKTLKDDGQHAVVLTLPDSICWLFNIRGHDIAYNPVVLAFAIVPVTGKPELFVAAEKLDKAARAHLTPVAKISAPSELKTRLGVLKAGVKRVRLDPNTAAFAIERALGPKAVVHGADPCILPKAIKNPVEITGTRTAHVRDGGAMARFLSWLDGAAATGQVDEITAVKKLEQFRAETGALKDLSFPTISGSGPNGAIVHYRVTEATNRHLLTGELFLIDSGAQYQDGTTDITRTVAIGAPTDEMRQRFTGVLRGHIAIATARFPKGTRGMDLDPFARRALWNQGADYDHGTGHGVGSFLSVHEGPQSISRAGAAVLEPGMVLSNEPGFYKEGGYGIRIENLVLVTALEKISGGADRNMMGFETLTLCPFDRRLIVTALLPDGDRAWLNAYHARVHDVLMPGLDDGTRAWLAQATAAL
jgi:Xaa-Pro aminopeptidase